MDRSACYLDRRGRLAALRFLAQQNQRPSDGVFPRARLATGFTFELTDGHPKDAFIVPNGLALCNLQHVAFCRHTLAVCPDLIVKVRLNIMREIDGRCRSMASKQMRRDRIVIPYTDRLQPGREFFEERSQLFRWAACIEGKEELNPTDPDLPVSRLAIRGATAKRKQKLRQARETKADVW